MSKQKQGDTYKSMIDVPYRIWTKSANLKRVAIPPILDPEIISQKIKPIIDKLMMHDLSLPFPSKNNYELWLLDREHYKPIVILNSCIYKVLNQKHISRALVEAELRNTAKAI